MKYLIENIAIKKAKNQNDYVELSLVDIDDPFNEPCTIAVFEKTLVEMYNRALAQATQASATNQKPVMDNVPDSIRWFSHAFWVTIDLPQPMFRRWGSDFTTINSQGVQENHKADELITDKSGNPKLWTNFRVLCKKRVDREMLEEGYSLREATDWAQGWSPEKRGAEYISSFFVPTTSVTNNEEPPAQPPVQQVPPTQGASTQPPVQGAPAQGAPGTLPLV